VLHLFDTAEARFGTVDVVVQCAGIFPIVPFEELTTETWDRVHAVNARGAYLCLREAVKHMRRHGQGGSIVNISSVASQAVAVLGQAQYSASKAAVNMLTRSVALEFADDGIRVNAVLPGSIDTPSVRANMARIEKDPPPARRAELSARAPTAELLWPATGCRCRLPVPGKSSLTVHHRPVARRGWRLPDQLSGTPVIFQTFPERTIPHRCRLRRGQFRVEWMLVHAEYRGPMTERGCLYERGRGVQRHDGGPRGASLR
jgi:NAD(P)-dependent dehydrogenase (short-subunit alcohol dehydrogenase family)